MVLSQYRIRIQVLAFSFLTFLLFFGSVALAQGGEPGPPQVNWNEVIAYAINTAVVFTAVQVIKGYAPNLPTAAKQLAALAGGPLLMMFVQPLLSSALGAPIDLSAISAALSGLASSVTAMAVFDHAKVSGGNG